MAVSSSLFIFPRLSDLSLLSCSGFHQIPIRRGGSVHVSLVSITLSHLQQAGQMGILHFPLVRVANHFWEERSSLVDMGEYTNPIHGVVIHCPFF